MVRAWYMDDSDADQRLEHRQQPDKPVSLEFLASLGVKYWHFDPATYATNVDYKKLRSDNGYSYEDQIEVSPGLMADYESKIRSFYDEHIHSDDEIRYVLDGSGYFDVRDLRDAWIRIEVHKGDMIVLPAGIYHRFTLDSHNYIKALRLFIGEPVWTPHSRAQLDSERDARVLNYRSKYCAQATAQ